MNASLAYITVRHPLWAVGATEQGAWWEAITRPTSTAIHVVCRPSLAALAARLDEIEPQR